MSEPRKYGEATTITFPLIDFGATDFEAGVTIAVGDAKISKDEGAFANVGASDLFVAVANGQYKLAITATQMQAARIVIHIIDQTATKEWEDQEIIIETYGHDSAQDKRFTDQIGQKLITPAAFDERTSLTSEKITRASFPDFGAMFTNSTTPTEDDFDTSTLVGTKIAVTSDPSKYFVILGGYFFNDGGDTTTKVFGIALEPAFGIIEGGTITIDTNWTGSALNEATEGDGWTFIVANHNAAYPVSGVDLSMFLKETTGLSSLIEGIGSIGYPDGRVIVDQTASNTNTVIGVDGTVNNPVSTLAAAKTLADQLGKRLTIHGVFNTQAIDFSDYDIIGGNGDAFLAGDTTTGVTLGNARVSSIELAGDIIFTTGTRTENCIIRAIGNTVAFAGLEGTHRNAEIQDSCKVRAGAKIVLIDCVGTIDTPSSDPAELDFAGISVGDTNINISRFGGDLSIINVTDSDIEFEVYSDGGTLIKFAASCTAGSAILRGIGNHTDGAGGITITTTDWQEIPISGMATNLTQILGTNITEGGAGRLADAFTKLLDVATATKDINDIGNLLSILGTLITESGAGDLADAFTKFLDVATATKDINDIGGSGSNWTDAQKENIAFALGIDGPTKTAPSNGSGMRGYVNGQVYFDQNAANTNTVLGVDGTIDNKVSDWPSAKTLALALGTSVINVKGSISITTDCVGFAFIGDGDLSAANVNRVRVVTASVDFFGIYCLNLEHETTNTVNLSANNKFENCVLFATDTLLAGEYRNCLWKAANYEVAFDTSIMGGAVQYNVGNTLEFDILGSAGNLYIHGLAAEKIKLINVTTSDIVVVNDCRGELDIAASCTAGEIQVLGDMKVTDNSAGTTVDLTKNGLQNWTGKDLIGSGANMIENDGGANKRFTAKALEKAPLHSVKRNTAIPAFKFVMLSSTTGNPVAGLLPITAERKLDADLVYSTMTGPKVDNGFGAYSIDINAADTNGLTGVWKFTAAGAETTFITIVTEAV